MSSPAETEPRKATSFGRIALVFLALFVVGVIVALVMHRTFVAAERVVARHVPADAAAVLRVDLEKATLFAPARRFLLPLLDAERSTPGQTRWERLAARSELVLGRDTREGLAMWGPAADDWALALGGNYPDGVLGPLAEVFSEEGRAWRREDAVLIAPSGRAVAQAGDRALLLASGPDRLRSVLPATGEHERVGIPLKGALAFVGDPRRVSWLREGLGSLGDVTRVAARADWSSPFVVNLELTYTGAPPADAPELVKARYRELVGPEEAARVEHALGLPQVRTEGSVLHVVTRWDHIALERLAERVAQRLGDQGASVRR